MCGTTPAAGRDILRYGATPHAFHGTESSALNGVLWPEDLSGGPGATPARETALRLTAGRALLDIALSSSADFVAWLHPEGQVVVTDIVTGIIRHTFPGAILRTTFDTIIISPQDQFVAIAQVQSTSSYGPSKVTAWNISSGRQVCSWELSGFVGGITISPDERLVAALNTNGDIALYDLCAQSPLRAVGNHGATKFPCITFSSDGSYLATSGDRTIKIWGVP